MAEVKKRHGWFSRLTFGTVSLALGGLLALSYVSVLVNPAKAWFFTIFGLLFIPVLVLTVLFFVWALFRRSRMTGFLLVMLLPWRGSRARIRSSRPAVRRAPARLSRT